MSIKDIADRSIELARKEILESGLPGMLHFDISLDKGIELAELLNADVDIVRSGIALMDLKLGQAFKENRIADHIEMSVNAAEEFLKGMDISDTGEENIIACIKSHHGSKEFYSLEAEICANADCYRFIHPKGIFFFFTVLGNRFSDFDKCLSQAEVKMDEKYNIISLPMVIDELEPIYKNMKEYFLLSK